MKRYLPAALAVILAGCTPTGLTTTGPGDLNNGSNLTTVAPLSPLEATLKTKEGLANLNAAIASLRDLKGSATAKPRGAADSALQQAAAGYHLYKALSTDAADDDNLPDTSYDRLEWSHKLLEDPTMVESGDDYVLTERMIEEAKVDGVAVEHYETTVTTRIPRTGGYTPTTGSDEVADYDDYMGDWDAFGGAYTRDEVVTKSEFRKLGRYVTTGNRSLTSGKFLVQATQDFTPKGETKTYRMACSTAFSDNTMTVTVKGDAPGGGSVDLQNTVSFTGDEGSMSGTFAQKGTIVTAKGETILVDMALNLNTTVSTQGSTMSAKGKLSLNFKDKLVLVFTMDQSNTEDKSSGALYAADGTTKLGTIAMTASNPEGTVTFNDGSTQAINMQTLADLMNIAQNIEL